MFNKVYEKENFIIFPTKKGFVVQNLSKNFEEGHTHLRHFDAAKTAIDLVIKRKIPKSTNPYYLRSLIRISQDEEYIKKIEELIEIRQQKGEKKKYYNKRIK